MLRIPLRSDDGFQRGLEEPAREIYPRLRRKTMMSQQIPRRRRLLAGCALAGTASLGLITFPLTYRLALVSDTVAFSLVCGLTVIMGIGAALAIFNLRAP
jgi:hypothetical protein